MGAASTRSPMKNWLCSVSSKLLLQSFSNFSNCFNVCRFYYKCILQLQHENVLLWYLRLIYLFFVADQVGEIANVWMAWQLHNSTYITHLENKSWLANISWSHFASIQECVKHIKMSFVFVCWQQTDIRNTNKLSWTIIGEPEKKTFFFGKSFPNMGGWGGWVQVKTPPKSPRKSPFWP